LGTQKPEITAEGSKVGVELKTEEMALAANETVALLFEILLT